MPALTYKHEDKNHPLCEAEYPMDFTVHKSDRRKSVIGDPEQCIEARGICKMKNVHFAHIGSGGDAYVGFKDKNSPTGITVRHFAIPAKAAKVRDAFDVKGSPQTQRLTLNPPSPARTLLHRRELDKKLREAVKNGKPVKKRSKPKKTRIIRLGQAHRPRAKISKGEVSLPAAE